MLVLFVASLAGRDYYRLLRVPRDADSAVIKKAHRRLSSRWHPDRAGDADEAEWFKEMQQALNDAAEVLLSAEKRALYDSVQFSTGMGEEEVRNAASAKQPTAYDRSGVTDILAEGVDQEALAGVREKADPQFETLALSFTQCLHGAFADAPITRLARCQACNGHGGTHARDCPHCKGKGRWTAVTEPLPGRKVKQERFCELCDGTGRQIPPDSVCDVCNGTGLVLEEEVLRAIVKPGAFTGAEITVEDEGSFDEGDRRLPSGDAVFRLSCEEGLARDARGLRFSREGQDLVCGALLSEEEFGRNTTLEVQIPGSQAVVRVEVPAGTPPGARKVVKGRGFPAFQNRSQGDLVVVIDGVRDAPAPQEGAKQEL